MITDEQLRSPFVIGSLPFSHQARAPPRSRTTPPQLPQQLAAWRRDFLLPTIRSQLHPYQIQSETLRDRDLSRIREEFDERRKDIERIIGTLVDHNIKRELDRVIHHPAFPRNWIPPDRIDVAFDPPQWCFDSNSLNRNENASDSDGDHNNTLSWDQMLAVGAHFDKQESQLKEQQLQLQAEKVLIDTRYNTLLQKKGEIEDLERKVEMLHDIQREERILLDMRKKELEAQKDDQWENGKNIRHKELTVLEREKELQIKEQKIIFQDTALQQKLSRLQQREEAVWDREGRVKTREEDVKLKYCAVKEYQGELDHTEKERQKQAERILKQAERKVKQLEVESKLVEEESKLVEEQAKLVEEQSREVEEKSKEVDKKMKEAELRSQEKLKEAEARSKEVDFKLEMCSESLSKHSAMLTGKENYLQGQEKSLAQEKILLEEQKHVFEKVKADFEQEQKQLQISQATLMTWRKETAARSFDIHLKEQNFIRKDESWNKRDIELKIGQKELQKQLENVLDKNRWLDEEQKKIHDLQGQLQIDKKKIGVLEAQVQVKEKEVRDSESILQSVKKNIASGLEKLGSFDGSRVTEVNELNMTSAKFMEQSSNFSLNAESIVMVGQLKDLYSNLVHDLNQKTKHSRS
ncbi:hypothetical protein EV368DRAFT_68478 [Lentinula lateritia]|nr:hypothetical protein EV368DRAFT_68478 [Lentinula lateritia]